MGIKIHGWLEFKNVLLLFTANLQVKGVLENLNTVYSYLYLNTKYFQGPVDQVYFF